MNKTLLENVEMLTLHGLTKMDRTKASQENNKICADATEF